MRCGGSIGGGEGELESCLRGIQERDASANVRGVPIQPPLCPRKSCPLNVFPSPHHTMAPQELVLSAPSSAPAAAIHLHDLLTSASVHAFKPCATAPCSLAHVPTYNNQGGAVFAVQEDKALLHVWAWQKVGACVQAPYTNTGRRTRCISSCIFLKRWPASPSRPTATGQQPVRPTATSTSGNSLPVSWCLPIPPTTAL